MAGAYLPLAANWCAKPLASQKLLVVIAAPSRQQCCAYSEPP